MAKTNTNTAGRVAKGTPTSLNIRTLARVAAGRREFSNQLDSVATAGVRRCLKAGLVEVVNPTTLRITDAGIAAINTTPTCTPIAPAVSPLDAVRAVMSKSYMDLDDQTSTRLLYSTRDNEGYCDETDDRIAGAADKAHARDMKAKILAVAPTAIVKLEAVDEWVHLSVEVAS